MTERKRTAARAAPTAVAAVTVTQTTTRAGHCMHSEPEERRRFCCWCTLEQSRVAETEAVHGPRFAGDRYSWHWAPAVHGGSCPGDAVEETIAPTPIAPTPEEV